MSDKKDKIDAEKFISLIKNKECLWNIELPENSKEGRVRDIKKQAWREVAEGVKNDWDKLNEEEQNEKIAKLKSKWQYIRKSYKDDWEMFKNNSKKPTFLDPVFEKTINKECQSKSYCNDNNDSEDNTNAEISSPTGFNDEHNNLASINQTMNDNKNYGEGKLINLLKHINVTDNSNVLFLLSLVKQMEQMTPQENLQFQVSILNLLKDNQYSSDQPLYTHSKNNLAVNFSQETPTVSGFNPVTTSSVKGKKRDKSTANSSINSSPKMNK